MLRSALIVIGSYLTAAMPVAYLTARLLGGVDLRTTGSKNVGASNVWQSASRAAVVPVGLAEIAQGLAGPALARTTGESPGVQAAAGVAAVAGHNWSPYLGFSGGRGVGHAIGFMLAVSWPALGAFIAISLLGVRRKQIPQFVGLGILAAPAVSRVFGQPREIVRGLGIMAALIFAKRLLTNDPSLPPGAPAARVLTNRLLYDRDTTDRDGWVRQGLDGGPAEEGRNDG